MKLAFKTLLVVAILAFLAALGTIEIGSLMVHRAANDGEIDNAYGIANVVLGVSGLIYGNNSKKHQELSVSVSKAIATQMPYFSGNADRAATAMGRLASSIDDNAESAKLFLEASRLANAAFSPEMVSTLTYKALERLSKSGNSAQDLTTEIKVERAYGQLITSKLTSATDSEWFSAANKEFLTANNDICKRNRSACRLNELRLTIGSCIQTIITVQETQCIQRDVMKQFNRKQICNGLSDQECGHVVKDVQPYVFQLLSLEKSR